MAPTRLQPSPSAGAGRARGSDRGPRFPLGRGRAGCTNCIRKCACDVQAGPCRLPACRSQCHTIPTRGPATRNRPRLHIARNCGCRLDPQPAPPLQSATALAPRRRGSPAVSQARRPGDTAAVWTEAAPVKSKTRWRVQSRACEVKDALARSLDAPKVRWLVSPSLPRGLDRSRACEGARASALPLRRRASAVGPAPARAAPSAAGVCPYSAPSSTLHPAAAKPRRRRGATRQAWGVDAGARRGLWATGRAPPTGRHEW